MKIIHLSDIHVKSPYFDTQWSENVIKWVNSIEPEILVVSGDLTHAGYVHELQEAKKYIDKLEVENKIIVLGNHDARNRGYKTFEELIGSRFPFYENKKVAILGLDSAEPDIDKGHVGRENYPMIRKKLTKKKKIQILTLHHHLVPVPGTGRERNILVDAGEVLKILTEVGIDFVFSGHKHLPWIWNLEDIYFITAGTATTRRLKGRSYPSFNLLELKDEKIILKEINVAEESKREILKYKPS